MCGDLKRVISQEEIDTWVDREQKGENNLILSKTQMGQQWSNKDNDILSPGKI